MTSTGAMLIGQASIPIPPASAAAARLFALVPLAFGAGIGFYFGLPVEPPLWMLGLLGLVAFGLGLASRGRPPAVRWVFLVMALGVFGVFWAGARTAYVAAPVLSFHYYGPVEGRIIGIDRSGSGQLRITLDQVRLDSAVKPERVRMTLRGGVETALIPGLRVMTTGHLSAPGGPVEPGGFDFRRHAWFLQLGGYGWTTTPLLRQSDGVDGAWLTRQRMALSEHIKSRLPGPEGGVAAALLTGDRSGLTPETLEDLRATNLAHLLAISGLHMGLVAGIVFYAVMRVQLWFPRYALHYGGEKVAAAAALLAASLYLALSGTSVATERAYIMTATALGAVLLDKKVLSVRTVAFAATLVLLRRPEALVSPGFQMSFAATLALIAVFREFNMRGWLPRGKLRGVASIALASLVAGLATLPFAAAHFNRIPSFGLVANLLSTPLMGVWIMPAGLTALLLAPIGLDQPALWVMGKGIAWILFVADWVASLPYAVRMVVAPPGWVLGVIALSGTAALIWQGRVRAAGLAVLACVALYWHFVERPPVLVSDNGRLVGVMTPEGRVLNRSRGEGFDAQNWLENDGDPATQAEAAARARPDSVALDIPEQGCDRAVIYLLEAVPEGFDCPVLVLPAGQGALAIWPETGRIISVEAATGGRPWSR